MMREDVMKGSMKKSLHWNFENREMRFFFDPPQGTNRRKDLLIDRQRQKPIRLQLGGERRTRARDPRNYRGQWNNPKKISAPFGDTAKDGRE